MKRQEWAVRQEEKAAERGWMSVRFRKFNVCEADGQVQGSLHRR